MCIRDSGHIKHNYVLIAGESYFEGGCEIPDGYVEPAPDTYIMLLEYARRGREAMAVLDADGSLGALDIGQHAQHPVQPLEVRGAAELADRPLSADQRGF